MWTAHVQHSACTYVTETLNALEVGNMRKGLNLPNHQY